MLFSDERITLEADEIAQTESYDEESLHMRQLLNLSLLIWTVCKSIKLFESTS
jgi:DNA-directed RNA polymerase subunit alpha